MKTYCLAEVGKIIMLNRIIGLSPRGYRSVFTIIDII